MVVGKKGTCYTDDYADCETCPDRKVCKVHLKGVELREGSMSDVDFSDIKKEYEDACIRCLARSAGIPEAKLRAYYEEQREYYRRKREEAKKPVDEAMSFVLGSVHDVLDGREKQRQEQEREREREHEKRIEEVNNETRALLKKLIDEEKERIIGKGDVLI